MRALFSWIEAGTIRLWNHLWPFELGKELPNRLVARATNMRLQRLISLEFHRKRSPIPTSRV